MPIVNCSYCGVGVKKKPSQIAKAKNIFCGNECKNKFLVGKPREKSNLKHNCDYCNIEFDIQPYKLKMKENNEVQNLFCGRKCLANWQRDTFTKLYNLVCKNCNKEFESKNSKLKHCSIKCVGEYKFKSTRVKLSCNYCGKAFTKTPSMVKDMNFCKKSCSTAWASENLNIQKKINCVICDNVFYVQNKNETAKTCSKKCDAKYKSHMAIHDEKTRNHLTQNGIKTIRNASLNNTKPERIMREQLDRLKINYEEQKEMYDKFIVDFYIPENNKVIEVFGDYWHGNPEFYGNNKKELNDYQIKQIKKDKARIAYLKKCGHEVIILWENDIYNNLNNIISTL